MFGLDDRIAELGSGGALGLVVLVAILLGLRHATDPDHLTAVSTLIASERDRAARRAATLGLAWGMGHAATLFVFGLPIILFRSYLPEPVQQGAEVLIGVVIMALAVRLLARWRQGRFHAHEHHHDEVTHRHLHTHADDPAAEHGHEHVAGPGRSPVQAFGIGMIHGVGGSAGVGVLLLASIPDRAVGVAALLVLAAFTAGSMALASTVFGWAITRGPVLRRFETVAPALGALSLAFGAWYALGALNAVPYGF